MSAGRDRPRLPARATPAIAWMPPRVHRVRGAAVRASPPCPRPRPPVAAFASSPSSDRRHRQRRPLRLATATPRRLPTADHHAWADPRTPSAPTAPQRPIDPPARVGKASIASRSTAPGRVADHLPRANRRHPTAPTGAATMPPDRLRPLGKQPSSHARLRSEPPQPQPLRLDPAVRAFRAAARAPRRARESWLASEETRACL